MSALRLSKSQIWRAVGKIGINLDEGQIRILRLLSEYLAGVAGDPEISLRIARRIRPRSMEQLLELRDLYERTRRYSVDEARSPRIFVELFTRFRPTSYQARLLEDESRMIAVAACRQSGKTTAIALRLIHLAVTSPRSRTCIVAPSYRQARKCIRKLKEQLDLLFWTARRAFVAEELKTVVRFTNGSVVEALPNAIERLRGETYDYCYLDEFSYFADDAELLEGVLLPSIATRWDRGARIIVSSTPWRRGGIFYKIFNDPSEKQRWSLHRWTWREAVAEGIISEEFIQREMTSKDPSFFRREYEAEWVGDEDSWLSLSLINCCLDPDISWWAEDSLVDGKELYAGLDLGKRQDNSVLTVVERLGEDLYVRLVKIWPLETSYSSIVGQLKRLTKNWKTFFKIAVDVTGVGEAVSELIRESAIPGYVGVVFTSRSKEELATVLKQAMMTGCRSDGAGRWTGTSSLHIPAQDNAELTDELVAQLNAEKYEVAPDGCVRFYHSPSAHVDVFWSMALAVYASRMKSTGGATVLHG